MAIQRKPRAIAREADAEAFMLAAPDAGASKPVPYDKGLPHGHKRQISLTIAPDLLRRVDERAGKAGIGRAAFISMAIFRALEQD